MQISTQTSGPNSSNSQELPGTSSASQQPNIASEAKKPPKKRARQIDSFFRTNQDDNPDDPDDIITVQPNFERSTTESTTVESINESGSDNEDLFID